MKDTIYRQAAIDALKGLPTWWADEGGYYGGAQPPMVALLDPEDAVSAIENLPSVQPDVADINVGNNDLISRQAALDILDGFADAVLEVQGGAYKKAWKAMCELPGFSTMDYQRDAWCEANCHPGPACPDGYCKEVYEALREEEQ